MKFKFYFNESKLYDFLQFPKLVFKKETIEKSQLENDIDIPMEENIKLINKADENLKPFIKTIELFYSKQFASSYDFIDLITDTHTILGYENEKNYFDMLMNLDEKQIFNSISYSILASNENNKYFSEEVMKKAEAISKTELISIIKDLPTEPATKWNLFLMIEEPLKYMKMYVDLMYKLLPFFEEMYSSYADEVKDYGRYFADFLNNLGSEGLKEISGSILDKNIINDEDNIVFITAIEQYSVLISGTAKINYIAWGLKAEEYFKRLKEKNENKVNERVHIFKNLGDKTRYEVLKLLAAGVTSTKEIAKTLGVSSATISYHLSNLLKAKIIKSGISNDKYNYMVNYIFLKEVISGFKEDIGFPGTDL